MRLRRKKKEKKYRGENDSGDARRGFFSWGGQTWSVCVGLVNFTVLSSGCVAVGACNFGSRSGVHYLHQRQHRATQRRRGKKNKPSDVI